MNLTIFIFSSSLLTIKNFQTYFFFKFKFSICWNFINKNCWHYAHLFIPSVTHTLSQVEAKILCPNLTPLHSLSPMGTPTNPSPRKQEALACSWKKAKIRMSYVRYRNPSPIGFQTWRGIVWRCLEHTQKKNNLNNLSSLSTLEIIILLVDLWKFSKTFVFSKNNILLRK